MSVSSTFPDLHSSCSIKMLASRWSNFSIIWHCLYVTLPPFVKQLMFCYLSGAVLRGIISKEDGITNYVRWYYAWPQWTSASNCMVKLTVMMVLMMKEVAQYTLRFSVFPKKVEVKRYNKNVTLSIRACVPTYILNWPYFNRKSLLETGINFHYFRFQWFALKEERANSVATESN